MELALWCAALAIATLPMLPTLVFAAECVSGSLPMPKSLGRTEGPRPPVAVIVPAHDEADGVAATLASIRAQMRDGDRLLVVADNCTDATASVARACGAEVLERTDPSKRGKGFALDFGLAHLGREPRPVVVFIDADCTLLDGALDALARAAASTGRPVQSCYLMTGSGKGAQGIAEFAFRVKNLVRPRGLARFGLPCLLTGSGMALPWGLVRDAYLGHDHLVEDMKLGLDLAAAGHAPVFCEAAGIRSPFPETKAGETSQRSRWENGHLAMIGTVLFGLFTPRTFTSRDRLALTLDVIVPPLTLLAAMQLAALVVGLAAAVLGIGLAPMAVALAGALLLVLATALAWFVHGRDAVPLAVLLKVPGYMLAKAWIYPRALFGRREWVWTRTDRTNA